MSAATLSAKSLEFRRHPGRRAPLIALVGCDGSGKSTLGQMLLAETGREYPEFSPRICHLGKQGGQLLKHFKTLPLVGAKLHQKAEKETRADYASRPAGLLAASVTCLLTLRRLFRFLKMRWLLGRGHLILTDRYPQTAVPGPMDGPTLSARPAKGIAGRLLRRLEYAVYRQMAAFRPDLVIRLNVDYDTAVSRKPDHRAASLRRKIEDVSKLHFQGAPILDLSALAPLTELQSAAMQEIGVLTAVYGGRDSRRAG